MLWSLFALCFLSSVVGHGTRRGGARVTVVTHTHTNATLAAGGACRPAKGAPCPAGCVCVQFLHFNDIYNWNKAAKPTNSGPSKSTAGSTTGTLTLATGNKGGTENIAALVNAEKKKAKDLGFKTIVTFGGDHLGPSATSMLGTAGYHMIEAMNQIGVDVASVGNHEFDFGVEGFLEMLRCSR